LAFIPFHELRVFQQAEQLCDEIWKLVRSWPYFEKDTLGKQLVKAADSIGANIAEGSGRATKKDNQRFVRISRGSLNETQYWLRRAKTRKLISEKDENNLTAIIDVLAPALNAYLNSLKKGPSTKR